MAVQRQIPGSPFLNETGSRQAQIPGGVYVNETVAGFVFGPARQGQQPESRASYAIRANGLALFMAAGAAFIFTGPTVQKAQAYYQPDPAIRIPASKALPQPVPFIAYAPNQSAAYRRDTSPQDAQREQAPIREWAALFQPVAPVYRFNGPTLQPLAPYRRDLAPHDAQRERLPIEPWYAALDPGDPVYAFTGAWVQSVAAYRRDLSPQDALREQRPIEPWFGLFAPAGTAYFFTGSNVQNPAEYWRVEPNVSAPAPKALPVPPAAVPYGALPQLATAEPSSRREWLPLEPWFGQYAPADPAYQFTGPTVQKSAAFLREVRSPTAPAPTVIPPPTAFVPVGPRALPALPSGEARREWLPLESWFGVFATADPTYVYAGAPVQDAAPYARAWPALAPIVYGSAPFLQPPTFVYPTPVPQIVAEARKAPQLQSYLAPLLPQSATVPYTPPVVPGRATAPHFPPPSQWFSLFATPAATYQFAGPLLQDWQVYMRADGATYWLPTRLVIGGIAPPALGPADAPSKILYEAHARLGGATATTSDARLGSSVANAGDSRLGRSPPPPRNKRIG